MKDYISRILNRVIQNPAVSLSLIPLLVLISHANIFQNTFVMDDIDFIVKWPLIQDWNNWPQFFVGYEPLPRQTGIYSPLKTLFHAVEYHAFGLNPFGYHVVSLLIHVAGIYFVYRIIVSLTSNAVTAFLGSLLFALHPVQVEAITYMTASVDMIGIVFLFASFHWYLKARKLQSWQYGVSVVFALLAIFTHELAISLPVLFLWFEICLPQENKRLPLKRIIWKTLPFFLITFSYAFVKFLVLKSITRGTYLYDSFILTMMMTLKAWAKYVWLCLFPGVLTHNHVISEGISSFDQEDFVRMAVFNQSIGEPVVLLSCLALIMIAYMAFRAYKTKPLVTFSIGWFFIALLPVSNIIPSGVFFAERYLYPGLLGFVLVVSLFLEKFFQKESGQYLSRNVLVGVLLVSFISSAYITRTWIRNQEWRDEVIFYEAAVRSNPQSALMRTDAGIIYLENNMPVKALESFQAALAIRPDDPVTHFSMADAYMQMGNMEEAKNAIMTAIGLKKEYPEAYFNLAGIYAAQGDKVRARQYLEESLKYFRKQDRAQEAARYENLFKGYFGIQ